VQTFEDIKRLENKASAVYEFIRREKIATININEWGKYLLQIERKKGEWLDENFPHGAKQGTNNREVVRLNEPTLQMPVTKHESAQARKISRATDTEVEAVVTEIESQNKYVTPNLVAQKLREKAQEQKEKQEDENEKIRKRFSEVVNDGRKYIKGLEWAIKQQAGGQAIDMTKKVISDQVETIVIFAVGSGLNVAAILKMFGGKQHTEIEV
jgi:hypothetical protein